MIITPNEMLACVGSLGLKKRIMIIEQQHDRCLMPRRKRGIMLTCPHLLALRFQSLNRNGSEGKDAGKACGCLDVASAKCIAYVVELVSIFQGEIRRPPGVGVNEFNIDFGHVVPLMNEFRVVSGLHHFLLLKSSVHRAGSGR